MFKELAQLKIQIPPITAEEINEQIKPVLRKMEEVGIRIDCDALRMLEGKLTLRIDELEEQIFKLAGCQFNIASPIQMADALFVKLKLPTEEIKKTKSGFSTAAGELSKLKDKHKIIEPILEHRELSKLISTYLKPLPLLVDKNSRLHTTYGLETSTGRLTSSEPNLQNIPIKGSFGPEIRKAFVASPGMKLVSADYSQIELRVVACMAQDRAMIEAFDKGVDIHTKTASEIFNTPTDKVSRDQRRAAKAVNFGIVYGQTPFGLSQSLGIDPGEAAKYIAEYFEAHPGIKNYINEMIKMAHDEGYVETVFGTRRYLPNINSHIRYIAESEERMAINMPVQGTAAEILKLAMIKLDQELSSLSFKKVAKDKLVPRMLLTVHDELVVEAPESQAEEAAKLVKDVMENVVKLCIPVEVNVGIGSNWAEAK